MSFARYGRVHAQGSAVLSRLLLRFVFSVLLTIGFASCASSNEKKNQGSDDRVSSSLAQTERRALSLEEVGDVVLLRNYNTRLVVLSTTALGTAAGIVGAFLLLRKRSLMGDALAHATLPGIAVAFVIMVSLGESGKSLAGLITGASVAGILGVLVMLAIRNTTRLREDVAMGFVLSVFFGLGMAMLGVIQDLPKASAAGLESFIYGKTASMVASDFYLILAIAIFAALAALLLFKEFTLLCFDEAFASAEGWPVRLLDVLLLGLVTAVTVIGLQSVGLILIIAFLITPPAAARFWTQRLSTMVFLAAIFGAASGWLGASISALVPRMPAGAVIVLVTSAIFLGSMIFAPTRGVFSHFLRQRQLRRTVDRQHLLRAAFEILEARSPETEHIPNLPFSMSDLLAKRTWKENHLERILASESKIGHLAITPGGTVRLSESGFGEASRITRNHRLWEIFLVTHADIAPSHVDRDADMVEHVLDPDLVQRLETELRKRGAWIPSPHRIERLSST
ncbi:MAG: iron chelate uptake ABC transporter family permease subunit [Verrucomicrobiota bacterium]